MSNFSQFMKANKLVKSNEQYAATKSLCDENGVPLKWEFRHLSSKEYDAVRDSCTKEVPIPGKANLYRQKVNPTEFSLKVAVAATVYPDLYNAELQDSYGVKTPEELLLAMVDDPGEYNELIAYIQRLQGFNISLDEKVEEAKN